MIPSNQLIVLVADKQMEAAVKAILGRPAALGIREIKGQFRTIVHPDSDPGTFRTGHEQLRSQVDEYRYALVICDRHGSGCDVAREQMELDIEVRLASSGWADRSAAVVIEPELEEWLWQESPHVAAAIHWKAGVADLYQWLKDKGYLKVGTKPEDPKTALLAALKRVGMPKSSSVFNDIASKVSLKHCADPAFLKLRRTLEKWFPPSMV